MRRIATVIVALFACVGTGYGVAVAATTGTNVSCATATASPPDHTVGVDGTDVNTISGSPTTATDCETQTYTVPTATETATTTQTATAQTQTLTQTVTQTVTTTATTTATTTVPTPPGPTCTRYASPSGSDSNTGWSAAPYATVQKLETSLTAGQVGCLLAGTYGSTASATPILLGTSGVAIAPITITSADPANPAQLNGWVSIRGDYITLQDVNIDGSNTAHLGNQCSSASVSESIEIDGNHDILQYVNYYQSVAAQLGDGLGIGFPGDGHGNGTIVRYSAIHDVGSCRAYDHLIYLSHGTGVQIYDNWLYNDAYGWGVQIYPAPTGAHIYANIIDRAGSGFVFASSSVSGNIVEHNVVANSTGLLDAGLSQGVGFSTCCGLGAGNAFNTNDVFNNPGGVGTPTTGLTVSGNITSDPLFVGASTHNYALKTGSPAGSYGLPAAVGPGAYRLSTTLAPQQYPLSALWGPNATTAAG